MISEARLKAQKKYDEVNRDKFKNIHLKFNRIDDADIIDKLESEKNKQGYIKDLIRKDIKN